MPQESPAKKAKVAAADGEIYVKLADEGKLGLGRQTSTERPAMVDALLPTAYAEVAKRSQNKDELLKAGSRLIRTRRQEFMITAIACGARHTMALSSTSEIFTWGSGCCGQLGHGTRHDEMLPRPLAGWHHSRGLRAHAIAAGSYHSMALITLSRHQPPEVRRRARTCGHPSDRSHPPPLSVACCRETRGSKI